MDPPAPPAASIPVPDELLEEIFLRLPTLNALGLASAACTTFRRVIKGRAFRRRFRGLHRPPLLGFMDAVGFHPAQAPHPSAELASALAPFAADLSFVPVPGVVSSSSSSAPPDVQAAGRPLHRRRTSRWRPRDVRDGRVLLDWISLDSEADPQESILLEDDDSEEDTEELGDGEDAPKRERRNAARFQQVRLWGEEWEDFFSPAPKK